MNAKLLLDAAIEQVGRPVEIITPAGQARTVRAFVQPLRARSARSMEKQAAGTGLLGFEEATFIGTAECGLCEGDRVRAGSRLYRVLRVEEMVAGESVYCWGTLRPEGEETPWND